MKNSFITFNRGCPIAIAQHGFKNVLTLNVTKALNMAFGKYRNGVPTIVGIKINYNHKDGILQVFRNVH